MPRKKPTTPIAGPGHNSLDRDRLRNLVDRIEDRKKAVTKTAPAPTRP
jgi:hypothetical protein